MGKTLVIVESPAKAKTIGKYLGKGFVVKASVGHVKDLPKGKIGVDVENDFKPTYVVLPAKVKVLDVIRKAASTADKILLACDPDREGEAIAWHVAEEIANYKAPKKKPSKAKTKSNAKSAPKTTKQTIHRILVHEITKKGVKEAIAQPLQLNKNLYEAQQARRILDRLVGYRISPLLWDKVRRGLSAGRVQSVAVRLICEREEEVKAFNPVEYWSLDFRLEGSTPPPFGAKFVSFQGKKFPVVNEVESTRIVKEIQSGKVVLKKITKRERRRHAPPPFITSRLQQDASQKLGYTARRTMAIAQQLYEGVELGDEGPTGLITYMRTDSTRVSETALAEVREIIKGTFGEAFLPPKPNYYKNKKSSQDAHEAIRPTLMDHPPEKLRKVLSKDQFKLYDLIWKRFVGSQMESAIFDQTSFIIEAGDYGLRASGSQMKFMGFLAVYQIDKEIEGDNKEEEGDDEEKILPDLKEGETLKILETKPEQHFTEPPPRFNEASLIKVLEEKGIGRPSTYAAIVSNIIDRQYVEKKLNRFYPTRLGVIVNGLLVQSFPDILNAEFTAKMEGELDEVEEGRRTLAQTLKDFYGPFEKTLENAKKLMKNVKRQEIKTDFSCEKCKSPMVVKWGRRGEFLACTNYPECKNTREFVWEDDGGIRIAKREVTGEFCAKCGAQMIIKTGRFGKFLACPNYPKCKSTRAVTIGVNCAECDGKVTEKRTKKGRSFYGCTQYPKCKFASWDKPVGEPCPTCQGKYLVIKMKKSGNEVKCPKKECDYSREYTE